MPRVPIWITCLGLLWLGACADAEVLPDRRSFTTETYALKACPDGEMLDGIDVSKWQGYVDWNAVAASGIDFAFIRVSDGLNYQDAYFQSNWSESKANGVVRGAYQFFRSDEDPVAQANYLLAEMGPLEPGDLPPVCDVETADGQSPATIVSQVQIWLDVVEEALGVKPIIYTSPGVWGSIANSPAFADYPLWVAHWGASCPTMPTGWSDWVFWQTSDSGSVPGVSGGVDTNHFNGDMEALLAFAYGDTTTLPDPTFEEESAISCPVAMEGQTLIQEDGPCARRLGAVDPSLYTDVMGSGGHAWWTLVDEVAPEHSEGVAWRFTFPEAGLYQLWTHVPEGLDELTSAATFEVVHGEGTTTVVVDQASAAGAVVSLGSFSFDAEVEGQEVRALDASSDPSQQGRRVAFDALEIGSAALCACYTVGMIETLACEDGGTLTRVCDGCQWSEWSACLAPDDGEDTSDQQVPDDASGEEDAGRQSVQDVGPAPDGVVDLGDRDPAARQGAGTASASSVSVGPSSSSTSITVQEPALASEEGCQGSPLPGQRWFWLGLLCLAAWSYRRRSVNKSATP